MPYLINFLTNIVRLEPLKIHGYIGTQEGYFSLRDLDNYLAALPKDEKKVTYEINSGGGGVVEGWAIHDRLVNSGLDLTCNIIGQCSSIATVVAMAAKPENRFISANAEFGIHYPYLELERNETFEAQQLIDTGHDLLKTQGKIRDLYVNETGQPKELIESMMAHSKSLTADEAKKFGFVKNITAEIKNAHKYRVMAFIDTNKKNNMDFSPSQKSWIENQFKAFTEKFNKFFTPVLKAMAMELENGAKIFIDSEDQEFKGKKVFTVDESGNKTNTAAPDGEYQLKDKRTLTVVGGVITEVKEGQPDETAALKKQVEDLTAQLATANTKAQKAETEKAELGTQVVAMKKEVDEFKNTILGNDIPQADQKFKGDNVSKSENEKWLDYKKSLKKEAVKN